MVQKENPILIKDLEQLQVSDEFRLMAKQNGFNNLGEIIDVPISELKQKPGMNYRMLAELGEVLTSYDLIDIVDED